MIIWWRDKKLWRMKDSGLVDTYFIIKVNIIVGFHTIKKFDKHYPSKPTLCWLCRNRWLCGNLRVGTAGPPKYSTPWLLWTLWILWGPPLSFFGNITHLKSVIHLGLHNFSCTFSQWWLILKNWSLFYLKMSFITYSSLPHKIFDSLICLRTVRGDFNIHGTKYF